MREILAAAIFAALISGASLAAQPGVNGLLAARLRYPLHASLISFVTGTIILIVLCLVWTRSLPRLSDLNGIPLWVLSGGLFGVIMVTASLLIAPRIGGTAWLGFVVSVQLIMAVTFDHYGLAGYRVREVTPQRLIGVAMLLAGVVLVCLLPDARAAKRSDAERVERLKAAEETND